MNGFGRKLVKQRKNVSFISKLKFIFNNVPYIHYYYGNSIDLVYKQCALSILSV